jgi:N6-adenosine-specific RNA methylase IME4
VLRVHPLVLDLFPPPPDQEFAALVEDIRAKGQQEPVVLYQGDILDGSSRYRACAVAGVEPRFKTYTGDDPIGYAVSLNLKRRHLSESQRAMVAARLATMRQGERTDLEPSANLRKVDQASAAALLNVSERSVTNARVVREQGDAELARAVDTDKVKVSVAADIATFPKEEQRELLAHFDKKVLLRTAQEIRADKAAKNRAKWNARTIELSKANAPLPRDRRYPIILADPPWEFEAYDAESGLDRAAAAHYPTMDLAAICALPVVELATPDAALFLWTTAPHLLGAFQVLDAWGFEYRTNIVWAKDWPPGQGYWVRNQHELLLIGARGDMRSPAEGNRPPSVIQAPRREHSRKPNEVYPLIERMYPELPKIELFARHARPGWAAWGNEASAAPIPEPAPAELPASPTMAGPPTPSAPDWPEMPDFLRRAPPESKAATP